MESGIRTGAGPDEVCGGLIGWQVGPRSLGGFVVAGPE